MNKFEIPTPRLKDSPHITLISPSGQRLQLYDKGSAWELVCRDDTLPLDPGITWLSFAKNGELSKLARFILERDTFTILQDASKPAHTDIEPDFFEQDYFAQASRWKRKNRIKQLKRSLERYRKEADND